MVSVGTPAGRNDLKKTLAYMGELELAEEGISDGHL
jgi:hypothetical protein